VLGTDDLFDYLDKYDLELDPKVESLMTKHSKRPWDRFVAADNRHLVSAEAMSFLDGLLRYVPLLYILSVLHRQSSRAGAVIH
jgi:casein kinase II subunit alpha